MSHSVSPGQRNWFYVCVSSYNCLPLKILLLVVAGGDNSQEYLSTLRSPQRADSAAGCQSASEPLLRLVCNVAKPLRWKGLFLVILPRKCLAAAGTHNLIPSRCIRVGD